ncbi:MAG: lysoplasmalogenase [Bacteroidaceae bacterium]|nr:lysoplasmalogenase [Bacteroidaceae bacterium]
MITNRNIPVISVYLVLAVLDYVPIPFPARMIFPLGWLTLCALYQKQWVLTAALFFSFLGDVMGWQNELIPQIGFFALAQIMYIVILNFLMPPKTKCSKSYNIVLLAFVAAVYGLALNWIFPQVEDSIIVCGIAVYAVLLLGMCYSALRHKNACLITGAILFVASDFILGIHLFVQRIHYSTLCIMIPYYLGQLLLFIGITERVKQLTINN